MDQIINEITDYFSNQNLSIDKLSIKDQLIYYKLIAIFNNETVSISDEEIKKIGCIKLLYDYHYKEKIRAVDIITAGDYPLALIKILKNDSYQEVVQDKVLFQLACDYNRHNCLLVLNTIKKKIKEIDLVMNIKNCTPVIHAFINLDL